MKTVIVVTVTYERQDQMVYLYRCKKMLEQAAKKGIHLIWLLVEDSDKHSERIRDLVAGMPNSKLLVHHLRFGPTHHLGHAQKAFAIRYIRERGMKGNVTFFDDDNYAHWKHFYQCALTHNFGIWRVNNVSIRGTEGPVVSEHDHNEVVDFDGGFRSRRFAIDTAGFCLDAHFLKTVSDEFLDSDPMHNWEDTFLNEMFEARYEAEPFGKGKSCYISHNEPINGDCYMAWSNDHQPAVWQIEWRLDDEINSEKLGTFRTLALLRETAIENLERAFIERFHNRRYTSVHLNLGLRWKDVRILSVKVGPSDLESSW